ncbi:MAG: phage major capsid protein [Bacilli bacterium]|nr:phage major capsid protein [Bacilli bacterium]
MTYEKIQEELRSLSEKLSDNAEITNEELTQIEERVNELESEKKALEEKAEKRDITLEKIQKGLKGTEVESAEERKEDKKMEVNYRNVFFKKLMGKELTEEERALTTTSTAVIPTETSDKIFDKMVQLVPLLGEIELFHVPGNLKFAVETTRADADYHTQNSTGINVDATAVLTEVSLGGYEFTKLIQVSDSILQMSVNDFEDWLVRMLAESIATKIEYEIINGSGSSAVKGIDAISYVNNQNGVQYNGSTGLTAANVRTAVGLLPGGYDKGAKFLMKKKTLFNQFMGLQDNAKHDLVRVEGDKYFIYGYPVILSDEVADGVAFLGNFKKYVGNLNREVEVKKDFDIDTNSYKYLGVGIFDGKPACTDAFVKVATSL